MVVVLYLTILSMLIDSLQHYGLSEKESKVYMAWLGLGAAPGSTIARHAGENRITVYSILKELVKRWIFTSLERQGVAYFTALSPEVLARRLEEKYIAFQEKLPELMALIDKWWNKPKVQFFEWVEGLKTMYSDLLSSKNHHIRSFLGSHEAHPLLLDYLDNVFVPQRVNEKISAQVICCESDGNVWYHNRNKKNFIEVKVIKKEIFQLSCEINIYAWNKISVALFSKEELSGILIQSKNMHDTLVSIFDVIWF